MVGRGLEVGITIPSGTLEKGQKGNEDAVLMH